MTTSTLHEHTARLSEAEIIGLTDYEQPAKQINVLHSRGFARAWIGRHGRVILERTHYDAVCRGETPETLAESHRLDDLAHKEWKKQFHYTKQPAFLKKQELLAPQKLVRVRAKSAMRRSTRLQRTPAWANGEAIKALYDLALRKEQETGVPHQIDHIVPLRGKFVSGLHVEYNLQILTCFENNAKGNRFEVTL